MILNYNRDHYHTNLALLKEQIFSDVKKYKPYVVNVCAAEEFVVGWDGSDLENLDVQINYLFSNFDLDWYETTFFPSSYVSHNRKVETWPTYFFKLTYYDQKMYNSNVFDLSFDTFKYPIMCLNKKTHNHRYQLLVKLKEHNLLEGNAISWLGHHSPEYLGLNRVLPEMKLMDNLNCNHDIVLPEEWSQSFLHIVTESVLVARFITEKTVKCLFTNTFFIVWGAPRFHEALKSLGFKLYDELIDYSFDSIIDHNKRLEKLISEINKIVNKKNYEEMYELIKPKLEYNKHRALELAIDPQYPKLIDEFDIKFYDHLIKQLGKLI